MCLVCLFVSWGKCNALPLKKKTYLKSKRKEVFCRRTWSGALRAANPALRVTCWTSFSDTQRQQWRTTTAKTTGIGTTAASAAAEGECPQHDEAPPNAAETTTAVAGVSVAVRWHPRCWTARPLRSTRPAGTHPR